MEKGIPPTYGAKAIPFPAVPKICLDGLDAALCITVPIFIFLVLINSGASFSIASTLYLEEFSIALESLSLPFLRYNEVSKSILFLSADGNASHILPSSAAYHRSIAML